MNRRQYGRLPGRISAAANREQRRRRKGIVDGGYPLLSDGMADSFVLCGESTIGAEDLVTALPEISADPLPTALDVGDRATTEVCQRRERFLRMPRSLAIVRPQLPEPQPLRANVEIRVEGHPVLPGAAALHRPFRSSPSPGKTALSLTDGLEGLGPWKARDHLVSTTWRVRLPFPLSDQYFHALMT